MRFRLKTKVEINTQDFGFGYRFLVFPVKRFSTIWLSTPSPRGAVSLVVF
jgi:hypothetical protein